MFGLFNRKKEVEELKQETKESFRKFKTDVDNISGWIKHLHGKDELKEREISDIKDILSSIQEDIDGLKNAFSFMQENSGKAIFGGLSKQNKQLFNKQTAVQAVQTPVQTAVQTGKFDLFYGFSIMERAIVWILANTDLKMSYDDIASMLGKSRSTIRGQINSIRQKSEGLVEEIVEKNGKKRVYIPSEIKEKLLKSAKVRVKDKKKKGGGRESD